MKKILFFILFFAITFSLSACGKNEAIKEGGSSKIKGAAAKKIVDWITEGESVECNIKDPSGEIILMAKNSKVRIEGIPYAPIEGNGSAGADALEQKNGIFLNVGDWNYIWSKSEKKGIKINLNDAEENGGENTGNENWEEKVAAWEDVNVEYDCEKKSLSNDLFKEPMDVEFEDIGKIMEETIDVGKMLEAQIQSSMINSEKMQEKMDNMMPEDAKLPEGIELPKE